MELEYVERPLIKIVPAVSNLFIAIMQSSTDPAMGFVCVCCAGLCRWWVSVVTVCPEVHASTDRLCVACVKTCHNTYCDFKQELDALRSMCRVLPQMQRALRGCSDQLVLAYAAVNRTATSAVVESMRGTQSFASVSNAGERACFSSCFPALLSSLVKAY